MHASANAPYQIAVVKFAIWVTSCFVSLESVTWDESVINGLDFMAEYVLQIPFFLMVLMRYIVPTLDELYVNCHPPICVC